MKQEQQNLPALSEADKRSCAFCLQEFEPAKTYAKCLDCELTEVLICIECLRCGTESHPHTRKHRYILCDSIGPVLLDKDGPDPWGAQEDLQLLNSLLRAHLNQWPELSKDWGRKRTLPEALERLDRCFLRDEIGRQVLNKYSRGYVSEWNERQTEGDACQPVPSTSQMSPKNANYSNELFDRIERKMKESISVDLEEMDEDYSPEEQLLNGNAECSFSLKSLPLKRSPLASTSTSPVHKRRNCFDEEEISDDDLMEMRERRMSTRSVTDKGVALSSAVESTSNSTVTDHRKSRKEQLLAAAKNVAAEALRGKVRKNSLELSEAINFEVSCINGKKKSKNKKASTELLTPEQLANLCASASFNPHFYNSPPAPMDAHTVAKFDEEDLQLLTYLPFRGEFEHEYKNEAEQLISRVIFPKEDAEPTEVDNFLSEVRYARFNRYNRLMRIRAAKKATILEHNLIGEYLSIVKTNISEKGKYTVFPDRFFHSKSKEDFFRPVFFQLRQIADRETINQLARDVGAIESLKEQIEELKCLQRKGVTQLKGRLKADAATPMQWSKKRKSKKSENVEQKKAGLRWKRIKRWTKRNQHLQHPESEGSSPRQQQQQPH